MDTQPTPASGAQVPLVAQGEQVLQADPGGAWALVQKSEAERVMRVRLPDGSIHEQTVPNDPLPNVPSAAATAVPAEHITQALQYAAEAGAAVAAVEGVASVIHTFFGKK